METIKEMASNPVGVLALCFGAIFLVIAFLHLFCWGGGFMIRRAERLKRVRRFRDEFRDDLTPKI